MPLELDVALEVADADRTPVLFEGHGSHPPRAKAPRGDRLAPLADDRCPKEEIRSAIGHWESVVTIPARQGACASPWGSRADTSSGGDSLTMADDRYSKEGTRSAIDRQGSVVTIPTRQGPCASFKGAPEATRSAIAARDVHKWCGTGRDRTPIVRGVGLSIAQGETVFLVGPSGSGKTTLLSMLGCILTPDRGTVEVFGRDVTAMSRGDVARFRLENLGFVFQTFNLFPTLSALDNVRMALAIRGIGRAETRRRAAELLDRVGLAHRLRTRPTRLSTGECQRVAIARALAAEPGVLLADEPTASLDAENGHAVMEMLTGLSREAGLTLVIVTHDNRIFPFADRILRLEDGRLADPDRGGAPGED